LSYLVKKKTDLFTLLFEIVVTTLTLGHLSLPGIRVWNVCMLKVYYWGIRFTHFCLDSFGFSVSNSPCQHLPSVSTQLGSIQLSCPESEREGKWNNVCVWVKERERYFTL